MKANTNVTITRNPFLKLVYVLLFIFATLGLGQTALGEAKFTQDVKASYQLPCKKVEALSTAALSHMATMPSVVKTVALNKVKLDGSRFNLGFPSFSIALFIGILILLFKSAKILFIIMVSYFLYKIYRNTKPNHLVVK